MESILDNLRCKNKSCNRQNLVEAEIQVKVGSTLGAYEVQRVALIHPRNLRSEVEGVLSIDKQYKTIQQLDLSAFSQVPEEQDLFWNLAFWFKYANLPYLWMAPYAAHLDAQDARAISANDQISSLQNETERNA